MAGSLTKIVPVVGLVLLVVALFGIPQGCALSQKDREDFREMKAELRKFNKNSESIAGSLAMMVAIMQGNVDDPQTLEDEYEPGIKEMLERETDLTRNEITNLRNAIDNLRLRVDEVSRAIEAFLGPLPELPGQEEDR